MLTLPPPRKAIRMDNTLSGTIFLSLKEGDAAAFEKIYSLTLPEVTKTVNAYMGSKLWWVKDRYGLTCFREEVLNDTYFELYRSKDKLTDPGKIVAWLRTVARRICCEKTAEFKNDIYSYDPEVLNEEASVKLELEPEDHFDLIVGDVLDGPQYWALRLFAVDGFSYDEIAKAMNCPLGTVRSRINTARRLLLAA